MLRRRYSLLGDSGEAEALLCLCMSSQAVLHPFLTLRSRMKSSPGAKSCLIPVLETERVIRTNGFCSLLNCTGYICVFITEAL